MGALIPIAVVVGLVMLARSNNGSSRLENPSYAVRMSPNDWRAIQTAVVMTWALAYRSDGSISSPYAAHAGSRVRGCRAGTGTIPINARWAAQIVNRIRRVYGNWQNARMPATINMLASEHEVILDSLACMWTHPRPVRIGDREISDAAYWMALNQRFLRGRQ